MSSGSKWGGRRWWRRCVMLTSAAMLAASCGSFDDAVDDTTRTLPPLTTSTASPPTTRSEAPPRTPPASPPASVARVSSAVTTSSAPPPTTASPTTTTAVSTTTTTDPATDGPPDVDVAAYTVFDVASRRLLGEHQPDAPLPVGSMMKLLTAYVALYAGEPDRAVTVPPLDTLGMHPDESTYGLYEGERLSRDQLLRLMLIVSASDAARVLAVDVAGSQPAFVDHMNATAAALGLGSTWAENPVGLDAPGAQSSARDMTVLAATLMQDPSFRQTVARTSVEWQETTRYSTNHDFLTSYPGAVGVKTGHTTTAGYCLAAAAERDGRLLIVVALGAPNSSARTESVTALLDWGFLQP